MIQVNNVGFLNILDSISFEASDQKALAVIGHNGAGKTTLFHILLGLKFADRGSFRIAEKNFGYVPERPYLEMEETLESFLNLHLNLIGFPKGQRKEEVDRVSKQVGLQNELKKKFKNYSKGMLQKALLAQALLGSPKLVFLDEPMSGLDPDSRKELMTHLQLLKSLGVTLVFTSHVMEDVESLANEVLVLDHGRQLFFGPVSEWRKP